MKPNRETSDFDPSSKLHLPRDLGPQWSEGEILLFINLMKQYGKQWDVIAKYLKTRSPMMIHAIYCMNISYLESKESTPEGLCLIMAKFYNQERKSARISSQRTRTKSKQLDESHQYPNSPIHISTSLSIPKSPSSLGKLSPRDPSSLDHHSKRMDKQKNLHQQQNQQQHQQQNQQQHQQQHQQQDDDSNKKEKDEDQVTLISSSSNSSSSSYLVSTKRKTPISNVSTMKVAKDTLDGTSLTKKRPNGKIEPEDHGNKKRKFSRKVVHKSFLLSPSKDLFTPEIETCYKKRLIQLVNGLSTRLRNWCGYEWCYSNIDHDYFLHSEFYECLKGLRISHLTQLPRAEWCAVRSAMGRPRRLSVAFLEEEREKLKVYRIQVRQIQWGGKPEEGVHFPYQVYQLIHVGAKVTALHPELLELHTGVVLTVDTLHCRYRIQFDLPELGVKLCQDTQVMPHSLPPIVLKRTHSPIGNVGVNLSTIETEEDGNFKEIHKKLKYDSSLEQLTTAVWNQPQKEETDLPAPVYRRNNQVSQLRLMAYISKLMERKEQIIQELQKMNDDAANMYDRAIQKKCSLNEIYPQVFQKQYAWLIVNLDVINKALLPSMDDLRSSYCSMDEEDTQEEGEEDQEDPCSHSEMLSTEHELEENFWIEKQLNSTLLQSRIALKKILMKKEMEKGQQNNKRKKIDEILPKQLVTFCSSLLMILKVCSETDLSESILHQMLRKALLKVKPRCSTNMRLFKEIEASLKILESVCVLAHREK